MAITFTYVDPNNWTEVSETVSDPEALFLRINELEARREEYAEAAPGVCVESSPGGYLTIGLGVEGWVLVWSRIEDNDVTGFLCSVGDQQAAGSEPFYVLQWTPIPRRCIINRGQAKRAVEEWCRSGDLWDGIIWSERIN